MSFLIPIGSLCVIERFGAEELAVEDLRLVLDVIFNLGLVC